MLAQAYCDVPWGLSLIAETLNLGIKGMDYLGWKGTQVVLLFSLMIFMVKQL